MLTCLENCENFEDSRKTLESKKLVVRQYSDLGLYLVKYNKNYILENNILLDEDMKKCRGLIMDNNNNVVCAPPFKAELLDYFALLNPEEQKNIVYEEFIDGTMINIFYYNGWHISTRSCIGANCKWYSKRNFSDLFEDCKNFDIDQLNKDYCYNFVLKHPENRIVTKYDTSSIVLVGAYKIENNKPLFLDLQVVQKELNNINIEIPKRYTFENFQQAWAYGNTMLNYDNQGIILKHNNIRGRIINPHYNYVKNLRGNGRNIKYLYFELRKDNFIDEFLNYYPEHRELFNSFQSELYAMTHKLFNYYQDFRVKKTIKYEDIEYQYRPLLYTLHGEYLNTKNVVTFSRVKYFVNGMPSAQILFVLNYKLKDTSAETSAETANETSAGVDTA